MELTPTEKALLHNLVMAEAGRQIEEEQNPTWLLDLLAMETPRVVIKALVATIGLRKQVEIDNFATTAAADLAQLQAERDAIQALWAKL